MEAILVKIFATALALSQVTTTPDAVKTQFDRTGDQQEVARLLGAGCTHMRKAFDIEDINLDELIATAMDDPQAMTSENKAFRGINFADLLTAYRQFCKNEKVPVPAVDLGEVIDHYNKAVADLPDHKRFDRHRGIDERGLIRAFIGNLAQSGRPQGGSTITQQIVKNLLVGEDLPQLFRQAGEGPDAGGGRASCRPHQGAELLQSRPASRTRPGAARLCSEPHEGG